MTCMIGMNPYVPSARPTHTLCAAPCFRLRVLRNDLCWKKLESQSRGRGGVTLPGSCRGGEYGDSPSRDTTKICHNERGCLACTKKLI